MQTADSGQTAGHVHVLGPDQVEEALAVDDAFTVRRVLARGAYGGDDDYAAGPLSSPVTELVSPDIEPEAFFVRKRIPRAMANRDAWVKASGASCDLLPTIRLIYELPDQLVALSDYVEGISAQELVSHASGTPKAAGGETRETVEARSTRAVAGKPASARRILWALAVTQDVCGAAAALHAVGVIHRDITPSNVIIDGKGSAHLIDLGIARLHDGAQGHDTIQLGTSGYAAPEQYGFAESDARTDVYALGGLLGFLVFGVSPSEPRAFEEALAASSGSDDPRDEKAASLVVPIVRKARSFEPHARYQDARELSGALSDASERVAALTRETNITAQATGVAAMHARTPQSPSRKTALLASAGAASPAGHVLKTWKRLLAPCTAGPQAGVMAWKASSLPRRVCSLLPLAWIALCSAADVEGVLQRSYGLPTFWLDLVMAMIIWIFWGLLPSWEVSLAILGAGLALKQDGSRRSWPAALVLVLLKVAILAAEGFAAICIVAFVVQVAAWLILGHEI